MTSVIVISSSIISAKISSVVSSVFSLDWDFKISSCIGFEKSHFSHFLQVNVQFAFGKGFNVVQNDPVIEVFSVPGRMKTPHQLTDVDDRGFLFLAAVPGELTDEHRSFARVLAQNNRLTLLPEVFEQFIELKNDHEQNAVAYISSAFPMDDATVARLLADLGSVVPGRLLDDDVAVLLRFSNSARGVLLERLVKDPNDD